MKKKTAHRFYTECFFKNLHTVVDKVSPTRTYVSKFYALARDRRIRFLSRLMKRNPDIKAKHKYLCFALSKCKVPVYLTVKGLTPSPGGVSLYCSKTRFCAHCWVRVTCSSFIQMVKKMTKYDHYAFAYKEKINFIDLDASVAHIFIECSRMFTKRHKFSKANLKRDAILGITETLCVYPMVMLGKKVLALQLRQLAYCSTYSAFYDSSTIRSEVKLGEPSVQFCSYPARSLRGSAETQIKIDEVLKRLRLTRRAGIMYNPCMTKAPTGLPVEVKVETSPILPNTISLDDKPATN